MLDTQAIAHPAFPDANVRTPLIAKLDANDGATYLSEWFGPIAFVIAVDSTDQAFAIARDAVKRHGALTLALYSTDDAVVERAVEVAEDAGVALSINLTGAVFVNQSAAFSDFHGTGANPAANAALTDAAFVSNRFRVVQHRARLTATCDRAMGYEHIRYESAAGIARLTLNRPDRLNSFNDAMHAEVRDALARLRDDARRARPAAHRRGPRLLRGAGPVRSRGGARRRGGRPRRLDRPQLQAARPRAARPAGADAVRGQRRRGRRRREPRARLRPRRGDGVGVVHPGVLQDRA